MNAAADTAEASITAPDWGLRWANRFHTLGSGFFTELPARGLPQPHWIATSPDCAALLGWPADWMQRTDALAVFSGNASWPGMEPLASVYGGHQFGVWAGQLGDGRALLLGEVEAPAGSYELQLKGSGLTPYSRMGDGRAVLRSSIREFLCSEAMDALRIPTTRALCITGSALPVRRETVESAAIVTRLAESFIRFGHFEHFAHDGQHREQPERLKKLADFVIENHFPSCASEPAPERYLALLREVTLRTADLMAQWQSVGFCHGVMNTDNMSILGLTVDYGPFGFLDAFDPGHICNHSDHEGRYAWARQPNVGFWNLHALAQALLPLIGDGDAALEVLEVYKTRFADSMLERWRAKLGISMQEGINAESDRELIDDLLRRMASARADFTITFRRLCDFDSAPGAVNTQVRDMFLDREGFDGWARRYAERLSLEGKTDAERALQMKQTNPRFVLRNHLAETAIREANLGRYDETERLLKVLRSPFDETPAGLTAAEAAAYAGFPPEWAQEIEVSCSS